MRIALCISGQPRSALEGFEYYKKNLFDVYENVDVFIHTWYDQDGRAYEAIDKYRPWLKSSLMDQKLPNRLLIDKKYVNTPNAQKWPPYFTASALYSTYECMRLKTRHEVTELEKPYDWVVKTRFDFALPAVIPFDQLQKGKLYMPNCRVYAYNDWLGNDQFAIGDSVVMNTYMSTFGSIDKYYNRGVAFIGEELLRANLVEHGLTGNNIAYLNMKAPFPPGPHNGTPHFLIRDDYEQWVKEQ